MQAFTYHSVDSVAAASAALRGHPHARLLAGGTTLIDLMKAGVEVPDVVIDINTLPLAAIDVTPERVRIGALARNSDVADDATIQREFPVLAQALAAGASGQLRNMATVGGNLLQRTRCSYFRDPLAHCNKRAPGTGCDALDGFNRTHAILGTSDACIATHASDMAVALAALDAHVIVVRDGGELRFSLDDFYLLPGDAPDRETALRHGDIITGVELTPAPLYRRSSYLKLRDRASYEFALVSVAACAHIGDDGKLDVRLALGGVGTVPWRARAAERLLCGEYPAEKLYARAATAALADAAPREHNAFKAELAQRAIVRSLRDLLENA